jgi:hypothetical protein
MYNKEILKGDFSIKYEIAEVYGVLGCDIM